MLFTCSMAVGKHTHAQTRDWRMEDNWVTPIVRRHIALFVCLLLLVSTVGTAALSSSRHS